jgi:hypothetical protein
VQILCQCCEQYQHLNCYGFLGVKDARIPLLHICYTCLFEKEPRYLKEATDLVLHRRGCLLLRSDTYNGSAELTEALSKAYLDACTTLLTVLECSAKFTSGLLSKFRKLGMMSPSPEKQGGKSQLRMLMNKDAVKNMIDTYFEPTKCITHVVRL